MSSQCDTFFFSAKKVLHGSVTYAISEKDYDKTLLTDELIDPDKQVRLELWAYNPKQFSEDMKRFLSEITDETEMKSIGQFNSMPYALFSIY